VTPLQVSAACSHHAAADSALTSAKRPHYYAVDHSPSYLWNSATWEISQALLPYLRPVLAGPAAWDADHTVRRAIEILDGVIPNPNILSFQDRLTEYPHARRESGNRKTEQALSCGSFDHE
jgi:hypothetical protein